MMIKQMKPTKKSVKKSQFAMKLDNDPSAKGENIITFSNVVQLKLTAINLPRKNLPLSKLKKSSSWKMISEIR